MTAIFNSSPRRFFVDQTRLNVHHGARLTLFSKPAVFMRFRVCGDELQYKTETDHNSGDEWGLVPPGGMLMMGLEFILLALDPDEKTAVIQVGTREEARAWHIKTIRNLNGMDIDV